MNSSFDTKLEEKAATCLVASLAHMEQEEAMLKETQESLREVRDALVQGDLGRLAGSLERQAHTARAAAELRLAREKFRQQVAETLRVSAEQVTFGWLAEHLPGEAGQRIARCRERLCRLAIEVDQLNRSNASLILHSLDFLNQLLLEITGGDKGSNRYGATGGRDIGQCGSLIKAQG